MLDMKKIFHLIINAIFVVSCFFWILSFTPAKKNKTIKRAKMRKWSTIIIILILEYTSVFIGHDYVFAITAPICLTVWCIAFSKIIEIS